MLGIERVGELGEEVEREGELGTKPGALPVKVPHHLSSPPWGVRTKARAVIPFLPREQINYYCQCGIW